MLEISCDKAVVHRKPLLIPWSHCIWTDQIHQISLIVCFANAAICQIIINTMSSQITCKTYHACHFKSCYRCRHQQQLRIQNFPRGRQFQRWGWKAIIWPIISRKRHAMKVIEPKGRTPRVPPSIPQWTVADPGFLRQGEGAVGATIWSTSDYSYDFPWHGSSCSGN